LRRRSALLAFAVALLASSPAHADRWKETGRSTVPVNYYQGVASDPDERLFFDGVFAGLYRTDASLRERAASDNVFPSNVAARERYDHIGDIAWDRREGGRVLLPAECYYPGTTGPGPDPNNTCKTGSIGVADPDTLRWRYYVKLSPAEVPKAMWVAVSPNGKLVWTQAGNDLLAFSMDDVSLAHAAPSNPPIRAVRRLENVVPPHGITGAAFVDDRLYVAANQGRQGKIRIWSIDTTTGQRRVEIRKKVADGESEGLDVFEGLGGALHWLIQRNVNGLPPYLYANGLLLHFVPRGEEPQGDRARLARIRLSVNPDRVERGRPVELVFTATARVAGKLVPIDKATVSIDGLSAVTDVKGQARIAFSSNRTGEHEATATRQNLRRGTATVLVTAP
jgi:hypothetical protein